MTSPHSDLDDNGGRCEHCNGDGPQSTFPVRMTDGNWNWTIGTMWLCVECRTEREALIEQWMLKTGMQMCEHSNRVGWACTSCLNKEGIAT